MCVSLSLKRSQFLSLEHSRACIDMSKIVDTLLLLCSSDILAAILYTAV